MQANVSTATTVQPLPPLARHPRTPVAEFVAAHMPDAGPCAGADVTPAWLDAKLEELARRLTASHRGAPALTSALAAIGGARGELAAARVDWGQVEARLRQVASTIVRVQNPRTPVATPAYARELARDLGVQIGDTAIAALPTIIAAIRATDCGDRRAVLLMGEFIELITPLHEHHEGAGATSRAIVLRHALAGFGMPKVRRDDAVYAVEPETLCPPLPPSRTDERNVPTSIEGALARLGFPLPAQPSDAALRAEEARRVKAGQQAAALESVFTEAQIKDARDAGVIDEAQIVYWITRREFAAANAARVAEWRVACGKVRAAAVAHVDAALEGLALREPGSLLYWWTRDLRRHLAGLDADQPQTPDATYTCACALSLGLAGKVG